MGCENFEVYYNPTLARELWGINEKFHFVIKLRSGGKTELPHSNSADMCANICTKDFSDACHATVIKGFTHNT